MVFMRVSFGGQETLLSVKKLLSTKNTKGTKWVKPMPCFVLFRDVRVFRGQGFGSCIHETRRDEAVYLAEHQGGGSEDRDEIRDAGMRDQPQIHHQHLSGDVREGGVDAVTDRAKPAWWQVLREGQHQQAEHSAGQAEKEAGSQKAAEQQAPRHQ